MNRDNSGIEVKYSAHTDEGNNQALVHRQCFEAQHLKLIHVEVVDQTDAYNDLVREQVYLLHPSEKNLRLRGNLFIVEDTFSEEGFIFLRKAPHPKFQPMTEALNFCILPLLPIGFEVTLYSEEALGHRYEWIVKPYQGGKKGRTQALHALQLDARPRKDAHQTPRFLTNTWGDRSLDSRINETFIRQEIEVAAELGVDVVQIDDGWQRGLSANSSKASTEGGVWTGFWDSDPNFWSERPEAFTGGLKPLADYARSLGVELGLWFAPDSVRDFENWERDAAKIVELYEKERIRFFKLDTINVQSKKGELNLHAFFTRVREKTAGEVVFDLDITAQRRPGFWGAMGEGNLFVENRYTDWHNYWPHQTLRMLWKLSHWVHPSRLRVEFLNHERNQDKYPNDPLSPACYRPDALFATTLFANPLGWFELSSLSEDYRNALKRILTVWKTHRESLFKGRIEPIGECPDGHVWTGFISECAEACYVLVFRELSDHGSFSLPVDPIFNSKHVETLAGDASAVLKGIKLQISIPTKLGYAFLKVS